ncbi:unnamed protein product [Rotaria sp. Silwood2]|nr:unnamed protein product [Rotaria sp. Silwood2]CAF2810232.1 unnamed protein product [Rotaria sp. Silwood2]CAF3218835.1 unnamed protein product [Rotaria sp. Silwood2]CAF3941995.1 unnamed protein product [Rotaria sp. Silwood2]CAF4373010.1 unnamed protein product [Rotaria sp. Silwood2]
MSSSTTKNFREVMAELLSDENIRDVPSIGGVLGAKLSEAGYEKVYTLFGKFLLYHKDVEEFRAWIQTQCGANSHQAKAATQALFEWVEAFI